MNRSDRREFLQKMAAATGSIVLLPIATSCTNGKGPVTGPGKVKAKKAPPPPAAKPANWDAVAFNKKRGGEGAIPESYMPMVNGADGEKKHLGKHLPYIAEENVPDGMIAIAFGSSHDGYKRHPASSTHWYDWIKIRKAGAGDADEIVNKFPAWPGTGDQRKKYIVGGGGDDLARAKGKFTVYLCKLPKDVSMGDELRVWGHCTKHGEYVDFVTYG